MRTDWLLHAGWQVGMGEGWVHPQQAQAKLSPAWDKQPE